MPLLYSDSEFLKHETGQHPECRRRLERIHAMLEAETWYDKCLRPRWDPVTDQQLERVHELAYAERLEQLALRGGGRPDADTVLSSDSYRVARYASGAACDAVARVLHGEQRQALCLLRPPGHHALARSTMGFCLFNHVAVAARAAIAEHQLDRVLIVDWDVHHGNGTQETFWEDPQVGFFSIHRDPFYPGSGAASETGQGAGLGTTRNLPVAFGTPRSDYQDRFRRELEAFARSMRPQLVLVSAGFDSHRLDPIGSLGLEVEDFAQLTESVQQIAAEHAEGRLVSLLEGGYNVEVLPACVDAHLRQLAAREPAAP